MKRGAPKRGKPRQRPSLEPFWRKVTRDGRAPCARRSLGDCDGSLDAHHFISKQHLSDEATLDPRNGVPLCRFHHSQVEARQIACPRPVGFVNFVRDHELEGSGIRLP